MMAAKTGDIKVIKELISKKIDLNVKDSNGNTALTIAFQNNHMDVVKLLIDEGADCHEVESTMRASSKFQRLLECFQSIPK